MTLLDTEPLDGENYENGVLGYITLVSFSNRPELVDQIKADVSCRLLTPPPSRMGPPLRSVSSAGPP